MTEHTATPEANNSSNTGWVSRFMGKLVGLASTVGTGLLIYLIIMRNGPAIQLPAISYDDNLGFDPSNLHDSSGMNHIDISGKEPTGHCIETETVHRDEVMNQVYQSIPLGSHCESGMVKIDPSDNEPTARCSNA